MGPISCTTFLSQSEAKVAILYLVFPVRSKNTNFVVEITRGIQKLMQLGDFLGISSKIGGTP